MQTSKMFAVGIACLVAGLAIGGVIGIVAGSLIS